MENNKLFREKSITKISSPEQLNDYVRVASPGVWMLICGIIILLVGMIIWAAATSIYTEVMGCCEVEGDSMKVYVDSSTIDFIDENSEIIVDDNIYKISSIDLSHPVNVADEGNEFIEYTLDSEPDGKLIIIYANYTAGSLPDGIYECGIITDSIKPIEFLTND